MKFPFLYYLMWLWHADVVASELKAGPWQLLNCKQDSLVGFGWIWQNQAKIIRGLRRHGLQKKTNTVVHLKQGRN